MIQRSHSFLTWLKIGLKNQHLRIKLQKFEHTDLFAFRRDSGEPGYGGVSYLAISCN